jgi:ectoine hydroxylase-related dioxygenase (phytanoyl-CoA dioxygenase family)
MSMKMLSSLPISVKVSPQEVSAKRLTWQNLELATRAIHRDGLVVLEDVVEHPKLDALNHKMVEDALRLQAAGDASPYNYNKGNIQQDPPATKQYFEPSIFLNPIATQVTSSILGPRPRLSFLSGNTALPPTPDSPPQSQPIHSDADIDHPNCPFALVVNVGLVDMTPENGSTEVWLGSHLNSGPAAQEGKHGERASGRIKEALLVERAKERPPSQPTVKKGSIIIRDLRLWHAGKPNFTNAIRVMLAMIHFAPWYRSVMPSGNRVRGAVDFRLTNHIETQCRSNLQRISAQSWTIIAQNFRSKARSCRRRTLWRGT